MPEMRLSALFCSWEAWLEGMWKIHPDRIPEWLQLVQIRGLKGMKLLDLLDAGDGEDVDVEKILEEEDYGEDGRKLDTVDLSGSVPKQEERMNRMDPKRDEGEMSQTRGKISWVMILVSWMLGRTGS